MGQTLKGAVVGLVCTLIFYFVPAVNAIAPLLGGLLGGYVADGGFGGGLKSGLLMTVLMVFPGFILAGALGAVLYEVPVLGGFVAASTIVITLLIVAHTAVVGIIGSIIGALVSEKKLV
ncbi:hypothetical protein FTO70_13015 [Methanosarcina sp. KYL-1]|uniref:DUF5518 domain-containing protein n=1 Tax=Methanosarcina sp. KYL-1 TaxID=2602068 RepID=UPI0021016388|nr:DUF5518 domain-containing protein [Methanosarcina sp. KYL-1]MCQ1536574.1 hypothetical protein [Methanosarcina sp. KYL-1]